MCRFGQPRPLGSPGGSGAQRSRRGRDGRHSLRRPHRYADVARRNERRFAAARHPRQQSGRCGLAGPLGPGKRRVAELSRRRRPTGARRTAHIRRSLSGVRPRNGMHRRLGPRVLRSLACCGRRPSRQRQGRSDIACQSGHSRRSCCPCDLGARRPGSDAIRDPASLGRSCLLIACATSHCRVGECKTDDSTANFILAACRSAWVHPDRTKDRGDTVALCADAACLRRHIPIQLQHRHFLEHFIGPVKPWYQRGIESVRQPQVALADHGNARFAHGFQVSKLCVQGLPSRNLLKSNS